MYNWLGFAALGYGFIYANAKIFFFIFLRLKFAINKLCTTFAPAIRKIGLWCNGNTADFGSVVLGSSPSRPTKNLSFLRGFSFIKSLKF